MKPPRNFASFALLQIAADWPQDRALSKKFLAAKEREHARKTEAERKRLERGR